MINIEELQSTFRGRLIQPNDSDYDEERQVWNGYIDKHPALIAKCSGMADVIDAVNFARKNDIEVSVRGGGHNVAGSALCDDGMVIDLSEMRGIHVDASQKLARVQGGATWGDLDRETQVFGLAAPGGVVSTTGVAGLTLGGGLGWMRKKHGLSCDNLQSVEIVTADGELLTASDTENPDLFWALRGGGGNFGIVTSFVFHLHEVGPTVMMCAVMYPVEIAKTVLSTWKDFMIASPDEISSQLLFWALPDTDDFPDEARGKHVIAITAMYVGDPDEGEKAFRELREINTPVLDLSGKIPYSVAQTMFDPFFPKNERHYYFKSQDLASLNQETMDALIEGAKNRPVPSMLLAIWHYGGEMNRIASTDTAFGSRNTTFLMSVDSVWDDPADSEKVISWSRNFLDQMKQFSGDGMYVNFSGFGEEGEDLVQKAYGDNYERLTKIKTEYDPDNFFHLNQNIKPVSE
ncbi:FAD-binding oxidoreductase [Aliifodinibius salicampi]|uniref:FAD-binding oxidoreductase n=1 Tax=Fodinibius salicampi TaxID=1920655 RepID=A0ABT3PVZ8_9BACT|nr:FAD-binding oxidoreductase [Fodinibius salicampi]MCW9712030.1 FAD-binding oxidoreductase [Fodinibius salicampi]